jgi:hypothetical protein
MSQTSGFNLKNDELLVTSLGSARLRMDLDIVPLWCLLAAPASASQAERARDAAQAGGDHVAIRQLVEDFGRYLYLPRVRDPEVLLGAIRGGFSLLTWEKDSFAYAESYDEGAGRYTGLRGGQQVLVIDADAPGLLIKSEIARKQLDAEIRQEPTPPVEGLMPSAAGPGLGQLPPTPPEAAKPKRFHGTVELDPERVGRDAGRIAGEVISHLSGPRRCQRQGDTRGFRLRFIRCAAGRSADSNGKRRTLKFKNQGFEKE